MTERASAPRGGCKRTLLGPLDAVWLLLESTNMPMHVGALMEFAAPAGASVGYLRDWVSELAEAPPVAAPFNLRPDFWGVGPLRSLWLKEVPDDEIDLTHHVRLWGLPTPGSQRDLGELISRLHSEQLDPTRPLWELHVIDGLEGNRFAMYLKIHHSLTDGVSAMRHLITTLSTDPGDSRTPLLWTVPRPSAPDEGPRSRRSPFAEIQTAIQHATRVGLDLAGAAPTLLAADSAPPSPRSMLSATINPHRRLATQSFPLADFKAIARQAECTINELVLYLCGTALREYLLTAGELPGDSLTAGIPTSLRGEGDTRSGTSIAIMVAELGTQVADPLERLAFVRASASTAKARLQSVPPAVLPIQSVAASGPYIAGLVAGFGGRSPAPFSLSISNVPGPRFPLYFRGAKLECLYPVSLLFHGNALNITCVSHDERIDFGFIGARDAVPHLQRIAVGTGVALHELAALLSVELSSR